MLQHHKSARLQAAVGHWRAASLAAAFSTWRQAADGARQLRSKTAVVVARMQHLQLAASLAAWREACGQQAAKRECLQACVARLQQGAAARCFASWREALAQRAQLRCTAERCILRLRRLMLSRAWEQVSEQGNLQAESCMSCRLIQQYMHCAPLNSCTLHSMACSGGRTLHPRPPAGPSWRAFSPAATLASSASAWPPGRLRWRRRRACAQLWRACVTAQLSVCCRTGR